jgi:hypothetical protein
MLWHQTGSWKEIILLLLLYYNVYTVTTPALNQIDISLSIHVYACFYFVSIKRDLSLTTLVCCCIPNYIIGTNTMTLFRSLIALRPLRVTKSSYWHGKRFEWTSLDRPTTFSSKSIMQLFIYSFVKSKFSALVMC